MQAIRQLARGGWFRLVRALVLEQELIPPAVLTPALRETGLVEHQRSVGTPLVHQLLLQRPRIADAALVLPVVNDAPTSAVDPVVAFDQVGERVPRGGVERSGGERHRGQVDSAASASNRARSSGAVIIGQCPESRST